MVAERAPIMVERLSAEELFQLDLARLAMALNEVLAEVAVCGRVLRKARTDLAQAKKAVILCDAAAKNGRKADAIDAQLIVQHVLDRVRTLKDEKSILQTLLRVGAP